MKIWSKTIESFLKTAHLYVREILRDEFKVEVQRTRFYPKGEWSWPISVVIIDDPKHLGYFHADGSEIGISKHLMYTAKPSVIKDILRHELCHYFTRIEFGKECLPHGVEFQKVCTKYGFGKQISSATCDISSENNIRMGDLKNERIINKIKKLLVLAESSNEHEAELATLKANQLLLQHNLDRQEALSENNDEVEYYVRCVIEGRRLSQRVLAISRILRLFLVSPVTNKGNLEVTGTLENIENAEYIAKFLDKELQRLWKDARRNNPSLHQGSFMQALSTSYIKKIEQSRTQLPDSDQKSLMIINDGLLEAVDGLYGRLSRTSSSTYRYCKDSAGLGTMAGMGMNINRGVSGRGIQPLING